MAEPDYIAQRGEAFAPDEARAWFRERARECRERGMTWGRYSIHPKYGWLLIEGWLRRPDDEGEPHWQVTAPPQEEKSDG